MSNYEDEHNRWRLIAKECIKNIKQQVRRCVLSLMFISSFGGFFVTPDFSHLLQHQITTINISLKRSQLADLSKDDIIDQAINYDGYPQADTAQEQNNSIILKSGIKPHIESQTGASAPAKPTNPAQDKNNKTSEQHSQ